MRRLPWILLVLVPLLLFAQAVPFEFLALDDELLILDNTKVHGVSVEHLKQIFTTYDPELYVPLTLLTYQIEWSLFGGANPAVVHGTNLILHILNVLLVFLILTRLLDRRAALLCALLFAVHPLQVESIAWASARKDLLSGFFFLGSVYQYLRYRDQGEGYWTSVALFLMGLLSKVSIFPLPLLLLLLDWSRGERIVGARLREKIPYIVLAILFLVIAIIGKTTQTSNLFIPLILSPVSLIHTIQTFFVPLHLSIFYPFTETISLNNPRLILSFLFVILLAAGTWWSLRFTRMIAFGVLWFGLLLAPSFLNMQKGGLDGVLDIYISSDRYAYLAIIGFIFLLGWALRDRKIFLLIPVIVCFGFLSFFQMRTWRNSETLFAQAIAAGEESHVASNNLAGLRVQSGDYQEAIALYEQSIAIKKNSRALYNLGQLYEHERDYPHAIATLEDLVAWKPEHALGHALLGHIYLDRGNGQSAYVHLTLANRLDPHLFQAHKDLGLLYQALGKADLALLEFKEALRLRPKDPEIQKKLIQLRE